jgi:hypothetical protein
MLPKNLESWQNLKDNLTGNGTSFEKIPIVVQYNKRDLTDVLSVDAMQEALGLSSYPFVEAVASAGRGITETFKLVSKLTFVDLLRRFQGRRPEDAAAAARPAPAPAAAPAENAPAAETESAAPGAPPPRAGESSGSSSSAARPLALAPPPEPQADRVAALESRLSEINERLDREAQESALRARVAVAAEERLAALENRLASEEEARRAAERATDAALASLSARAGKLYQEIAGILRLVSDLEASLNEKAAQGLREAEDIRAQIAPLLEARDERGASEERNLARLDLLRESLADSLGEIADRLRRAVRDV